MHYYYKVSDGSRMDFEDFMSYVELIMQENDDSVFENWFSHDDFSAIAAYNYINDLLTNDKRISKLYCDP